MTAAPLQESSALKQLLDAAHAENQRLQAENQQLRDAFAEYRLWEPGRRGYAMARRRLEEAFGYVDWERLARDGGLAE